MYIAYGLKCGDCHDSAPPREVTYHASSHSACHFECHLFPSQKMRSLLQRSIGRLGQGPLPGCENTRSHCWAVTETQGHTAGLGQRHKLTLLGWDKAVLRLSVLLSPCLWDASGHSTLFIESLECCLLSGILGIPLLLLCSLSYSVQLFAHLLLL